MTKKEQRLVSKIQFNAYELNAGGQIPPALFIAICKLNKLSKVEDVKFLVDLSDHLLRVKGYYKRHKDICEQVNEEVKNACLERSIY